MNSEPRQAASRTASRVLPTPPVPVKDTSRDVGDNPGKLLAQFLARPTKLVSSGGKSCRNFDRVRPRDTETQRRSRLQA